VNRGRAIVGLVLVAGGLAGGLYVARGASNSSAVPIPIPIEPIAPIESGVIIRREELRMSGARQGVPLEISSIELSHLDPGVAVVSELRTEVGVAGVADRSDNVITVTGQWADRERVIANVEGVWANPGEAPAGWLRNPRALSTVHDVIGFELAQRMAYQPIESTVLMLDASGEPMPVAGAAAAQVPGEVTHELRADFTLEELGRLFPLLDSETWGIPSSYSSTPTSVVLGFDDRWVLRWVDVTVDLETDDALRIASVTGEPFVTGYRLEVESIDGEMPPVAPPVAGVLNTGFESWGLDTYNERIYDPSAVTP
jgi:hypothetical protein